MFRPSPPGRHGWDGWEIRGATVWRYRETIFSEQISKFTGSVWCSNLYTIHQMDPTFLGNVTLPVHGPFIGEEGVVGACTKLDKLYTY